MNHFNNALPVFSAAFYACFGNSNLSWPLKPQDPLGNRGQNSQLQLQQARLFLPMHPSACQGLPVSHAAVLGSTPCCFPDWKKKKSLIIRVVFLCYPSALILGSPSRSYLKGLMVLRWSHGTLTHGPSFSSRFHRDASSSPSLSSCLSYSAAPSLPAKAPTSHSSWASLGFRLVFCKVFGGASGTFRVAPLSCPPSKLRSKWVKIPARRRLIYSGYASTSQAMVSYRLQSLLNNTPPRGHKAPSRAQMPSQAWPLSSWTDFFIFFWMMFYDS